MLRVAYVNHRLAPVKLSVLNAVAYDVAESVMISIPVVQTLLTIATRITIPVTTIADVTTTRINRLSHALSVNRQSIN